MGKPEGEQTLPTAALAVQGRNTRAGVGRCCFSCARIRNWVNCRCILVLVLGCAVFLSAVFWLPFFHFGDRRALDLEYKGYDIVASFMLRKPAFYLKEQKSQLQEDIFNEISFSSTEVQILSLQSHPEPNLTSVIFSVKADSTTQSLIRSSFMSLVTGQSSLHLTAPLFGDPFSFEVLKFKGGLTVSPVQKAFLMQGVQIVFNFTLNFSVDDILQHFDQLSNQLRRGLHLASYENLYISLTNQKGSTVTPPTKVISEVLLAVGINPSQSRLKQLAQTITGFPSRNLGLNNTVFGRVKQISLSSILQHSLGHDGSPPSPSPSPSASRNHYHHGHHNHYHHHDSSPAPRLAPLPSHGGHVNRRGQPTSALAPAPASTRKRVPTPQPCHHGGQSGPPGDHNTNAHFAPSASPSYLHQNKLPPNLTPGPKASPPNPVHASGDSPSTGERHESRLVPTPGVSQLQSSSSVDAITSNSWSPLLFMSSALLFMAS